MAIQKIDDTPKSYESDKIYYENFNWNGFTASTLSTRFDFSLLQFSLPRDLKDIKYTIKSEIECYGMQIFFSAGNSVNTIDGRFKFGETSSLDLGDEPNDFFGQFKAQEPDKERSLSDAYRSIISQSEGQPNINLYVWCPFWKERPSGDGTFLMYVEVSKDDSVEQAALVSKSHKYFDLFVDYNDIDKTIALLKFAEITTGTISMSRHSNVYLHDDMVHQVIQILLIFLVCNSFKNRVDRF